NWVGGACWWLEPLQARLAAHVFGSTKLFADDTPIPVLDPGRGRTKTGRLWVYARDDRPWSGPEPPAAVYFYSPDRKAERPAAHLQDFRGVLQVDGYAGFERLTAPGGIVLAACWAHARRKFYDLHEATGSPIAAEALRRIAELYAIERSIQGRTADARRHVRNTSARPLIEMMSLGSRWSLAAFHPPAPSPRPFVMRSRAGQPSPDSSMTAASNSTTIRSSAPSGPSRSGARTICSPARTVAGSDGQPSAPSSP